MPYTDLDIPRLLDLLANETLQHTRAFASGHKDKMLFHKINIEAIIAAIQLQQTDKQQSLSTSYDLSGWKQ